MKRVWGLIVVMFVLGSAALAQTYTPPTLSTFQATLNQVGAVASSSNISANLPGYQGDPQNLQSHANDTPAQLQSMGQTSMMNSSLTPVVNSNNAYKAANVIDPNTGWVQNALNAQNNPSGTAGSTVGTGGQACSTSSASVVQHDAYVCDTGNVIGTGTQVCTLDYVPTIKTDYIYTCKADWVDGVLSLVPDARCADLGRQAACSLQAQSCSTSSTTGTYNYSCQVGQQYAPTTPTCTSNTTASQYNYVCNANWMAGQGALVPDTACNALATSGICTQTGATCTQGATTQTQSYSCFLGTQTQAVPQQCTTTHNVGTSTEYQYQCDRSEFFDKYSSVPNVDTMIYINECVYGYAHNGSVQTNYGCGYITTNMVGHCAGGDQFKSGFYLYMCDTPITSVGGIAMQGTINNACMPYSGNGTCHEVPPPNCTGMMYSIWCRSNIHTYQCSGQVGASAPSATVTVYHDLGTDSSQCSAFASDPQCTQSGSTCATTMDPMIASALGLPAGTCATTTVSYTCNQSTPVNYCTGNAPTGAGWTEATNTVCHPTSTDSCGITETVHNWTLNQGVGGCQTEQRNYSCTGDVPAADPAASINLSTDSTQCQAMQANPACHVSGTSCAHMTNYSAAELAAMGKSAQFCDQVTTNYTCDGYTAVNSCSAPPPTGSGWNCTPTQTCIPSGSNPCAITQTSYSCSRTEGVNGCKQATLTYDCTADQPADDPYDQVIKTVIGGTYTYNPACAAATNAACTLDTTTCNDAGGTRIVNGASVTASCWQKQESYTCNSVTGTTSDCAPAANCTLQSQVCLDANATSLANCNTIESHYDCVSTIPGSPQNTCTTSYSNTNQTITAQDDPDDNFAQAMAGINTVKGAGASYASAPDLKIFNGQDLRCKKSVLGLYNCCKDTGLQLLNLVGCSADEKNLFQQQTDKSCHYVGSYCSNKTIFGCAEKKLTYCCYGSVLARIIQEAGHQQLGKAWGDPKNPVCGGFSVAEFQSLDLSNVDFSDFYASKLSTLNQNSPNSVVSAITASLNSMTATQSPTHP